MTDVSFTPDPALYPFTSRWLETSAGRMHYIDEGSGPPILFCHGNPTWSFLYRGIITRLRDRFRCVAADLHGFGLSERPDQGYGYTAAEHVRTLGELVDNLGLDGFVVMGQDWGGPTGLGVATARAERVRGVVLGNTWFWPSDGVMFKLFSGLASSPPMQWLITQQNIFVRAGMPGLTARKLSAAEFEHYRAVQPTPAARVGVATFPREIQAARPLLAELERTVPERLGGKPALVTWGLKDWGFRAGERERVRAAFPGHEYVALPHASHFIQEDAPGEIADAIGRGFSGS
jgi:haloalkane dehalogenase